MDNYRVDVGEVFDDLEACGAIARDDGWIADGMDKESRFVRVPVIANRCPPLVEGYRDCDATKSGQG